MAQLRPLSSDGFVAYYKSQYGDTESSYQKLLDMLSSIQQALEDGPRQELTYDQQEAILALCYASVDWHTSALTTLLAQKDPEPAALLEESLAENWVQTVYSAFRREFQEHPGVLLALSQYVLKNMAKLGDLL